MGHSNLVVVASCRQCLEAGIFYKDGLVEVRIQSWVQSRESNEVRNLSTKPLAYDVVEAKVLSSIDSAQSCLFGCLGEAVEVPCDSGERLGGYVQRDPIAEVLAQCLGCGSADGAVGSRIGRIGSGFC